MHIVQHHEHADLPGCLSVFLRSSRHACWCALQTGLSLRSALILSCFSVVQGLCIDESGGGWSAGSGAAASCVWVGHLLAVQLPDAPVRGARHHMPFALNPRAWRPSYALGQQRIPCSAGESRAVTEHALPPAADAMVMMLPRGLVQVALFRLVGAACQTSSLANASS